jgi:septal ring factor EnvC (AmiA/AmiB activator)
MPRFGQRSQTDDVAPRVLREVREDGRSEPRTLRSLISGVQPALAQAQPALASQRLRRVAEYFAAQEDLLREMRHQLELETAPLAELLYRQHTTLQRTLQNLDDGLQPVNEYADQEEANLAALEERIAGEGMDFIARSFAEYVTTQRKRIEGARAHIDEQRTPFLRFAEDQRFAMEVALSRFDDDVQALEHNLTEQRKVLLRLLDALRSDGFLSVRELLAARHTLLEELADAGVTDPLEIAAQLNALRTQLPLEGSGTHLQAVVAATDAADQRLASSGAPTPRPMPRARSLSGEAARTGEEPLARS